MAGEIVTKSKRFYCVSIVPDFCRTPIGSNSPAIPYMIIGEFSEATGVSTNITSNGEPVVIHGSTVIPTVKGDEPGVGGGIKSNTVGGRVQAMEKSSTLSFNGERAVRVGDLVYMNDKNTIGKVFERLDASALKAFRKACEPGGTLAVLTEALEAQSFIPCELLNLIPGGPLISNAASVPNAGRADASQYGLAATPSGAGPTRRVGDDAEHSRSFAGALNPAGVDGGVSRGRDKGGQTNSLVTTEKGPRFSAGDTKSRTRVLATELYPEFPVWASKILVKNNVSIYKVQNNVVEAFPWLHGVHPPGHPLGTTYDQLRGVYLKQGTVAIAVEGIDDSGSFDVGYHELAHAVDDFGNFSTSEEFRDAWGKDYDNLRMNYFKGARTGLQETFAEGFARFYGRDPEMPKQWPHLYRYFQDLEKQQSKIGVLPNVP